MRRVLLMTGVLCGVVWLVVGGVSAGAAWRIETVDTAGVVGLYTSLALEASRYPRISYYDETNGDLKYAVWNGISWQIMTVDSAGDVGQYTSLALDPATRLPHISYYDRTNKDLKYVTFWNTPPFGWLIYTVDSAGDVGQYTSLALDPVTGWPRISYFNRTNASLKYAAWNGSSWDIQTVDNAGWVGEYSSLMLDASGYPHISYYDSNPNYDLKYAAWNGSRWDIETVQTAWDVGRYTSLGLDASGYPHISYSRRTTQDLRYAAWNGASWDLQAVDSAGDVGEYTSLALDASGYPRISYYDETNGDLKYAAWNGSSWDIERVDRAGGMYTSLALDANGDAHISSYAATMRDLKYATTRPPAEASHELPATGYYMISFPLIPPSPTPHALLCDDLGDGNYYMWRWEGGGYQTIPTSPPGCQTTTLSIEEGYWILAQGAALDIGGTQPSGDQAIPLQAGWNMVAAPYEATLDSLKVNNGGDVRSLAEAQTAGWVLATFYYSHDGTGSYSTVTTGQTPADTLSLWHGYWGLAGLECSLILPPPFGGAGATAITALRKTPMEPVWAFDIRASSASFADTITIAAADSASDGFDGFALDRPKPPAAPGEGRLRMVLRAEGWRGTEPPPYNKAPGRQMPWASELAAETKGTAEDAAEWQFIVTGGVEGEPVMLTWPELGRLPKDRVAILTDRDTGKRTFMRTRARYEFMAPGDGSSRSFAVTVKPAQQAGVLISSFSVVPLRGGGAELTFSLSADAVVSLQVLNVAGRLVQRIRGGVPAEAGRHMAAWNGRSLSGAALPNGLYLCVLMAKAADGQQARAVRPISLSR